jgi:hypothetical protein
VIIVGSQSILGTFREDQLPPKATVSAEADVLYSRVLCDDRPVSPRRAKALGLAAFDLGL